MFKKLTSMVLAGVMVLSVMASVTAADINQSGGSGNSTVMLDIDARNLKVTVPSVLPIWVDSDNNVTVATDAKIQNRSDGPVDVTDVSVEADNNWSLVDFNTDFSKVPVDTKQYGMTMYNDDVIDGVDLSLFDRINGSDEIAVVYDGNVAIQSSDINKFDIGHVVFTVSWADNDVRLGNDFVNRNDLPSIRSSNLKFFKSHGLALDGNVGIKYLIDPVAAGVCVEDVASGDVSLSFDFSWNTSPAPYSNVAASNIVIDSTNYRSYLNTDGTAFVLSCYVAAAEMTCVVHVDASVRNRSDDVLYSDSDDYCVRDYASYIIDTNNESNSELSTLLKAMLDYGAKAQVLFNIKTDDLANKSLVNYVTNPVTSDMIDTAISTSNDGRSSSDLKANTDNFGLTYAGATVVFLSGTTLRFYYTIKDQALYDSVKNNTTFTLNESKLPYVMFERTDVPAQDFDVLQEFTINGQTYYYSVLNYSRNVLNSTKMDNASKELAMATYWYNQAANEYFD